MKSILSTSLAALLLSACANPVNLKIASDYARGCHGFQAQGEWWKARRACGRAADNARLGGASERTLAVLWYEYGRTSGAICDYQEARKGLEEAIRLDRASGGPVYMSLLELARLEVAQGQFALAIEDYEKFWGTVPKGLAEQKDPVGAAEVFEEQAEASRRTGNDTAANDLAGRARALRAANPGKTSNTDHTPYGKFCDQRS